MKKLTAFFALIICFCFVCFAGCKSGNQSSTDSKTFQKYFSYCTAIENSKSTTYTTKSVFTRNASAYTSLAFLGDAEWTEGLFAKKIILHVVANKTTDIDMLLKFTTNNETISIPVIVSVVANEESLCEISLNKTLVGETSLLFELSNIGGAGLATDGLLFDTNGVSTGFVWKISFVDFEGTHEV